MTETRHPARPLGQVLFLSLVLLGGCERKGTVKVDLSKRSRLPAVAAPRGGPESLRVAVSAMVSPQATFGSYEALVRLIGRRLQKDVVLVQRKTYADVNNLLRDGEVHAAFVCTGAFVAGEEEFGLEAIAVPVVRGRTTYRSVVIVRDADPAETFDDLRGRSFAFTDPMSNTGRLYPLALLRRTGRDPQEFFSGHIFTGSHDRSIEAVREGLVDAAAVDSLVYEGAAAGPEARVVLKVIQRSPEFGMPPVVASPGLEKDVRDRIAACLLSLGHDSETKSVLAGAGIERFVKPVSSWYDSVREMRRSLAESGWIKR